MLLLSFSLYFGIFNGIKPHFSVVHFCDIIFLNFHKGPWFKWYFLTSESSFFQHLQVVLMYIYIYIWCLTFWDFLVLFPFPSFTQTSFSLCCYCPYPVQYWFYFWQFLPNKGSSPGRKFWLISFKSLWGFASSSFSNFTVSTCWLYCGRLCSGPSVIPLLPITSSNDDVVVIHVLWPLIFFPLLTFWGSKE